MTAVLGLKPGHDGGIALIVDGELVFALEGEKDSFPRNGPLTASLVVEAMLAAPVWPDVVAIGGWHKVLPGRSSGLEAGYLGLEPGRLEARSLLGRPAHVYSSSHERSHLFSGVGMSPFDPDGELAILVWEGVVGAFYRWRAGGAQIERIDVLDQPGARYSALFGLADPAFPARGAFPPAEYAGKLMALIGFADGQGPSDDSRAVVAEILKMRSMYPFDKGRFHRSPLYDCGLDDPELHRAARLLSDELFERFRRVAEADLPRGIPLVVVGGCGLNCDWNSAWCASGLFEDVFVPPCPNDAGSAIGTAVDAWVQAGGSGHLEWDVYRGAPFVHDLDARAAGWTERSVDHAALSAALEAGHVVAWVQGRCEIGPRALGHRSLLASAALSGSKARLNDIKLREGYRPIAPMCLEEDLGTWFDDARPDPWMLHFRRCLDPSRLPSVAHVDGSARVQSVTRRSCPEVHRLLVAHRARTGAGVLCNTSLNFNGTGFINRTSDLLHYCDWTGIDHVVIDDRWLHRDHGGARLRDGGRGTAAVAS